jgi:hypothetical protein
MRRFVIALVLMLWCFSIALSGQIDPASGILPFSTQAGSLNESIDIATGNILFNIPIRSKVGTPPFVYSLMMNSHIFNNVGSWWVTYAMNGIAENLLGASWSSSFSGSSCTSGMYWTNISILDSTGAAHPLPTSFKISQCSTASLGATVATDGSGYTLVVSNQESGPWWLYDRNGNHINVFSPSPPLTLYTPDGETITETETNNGVLTFTFTDSLQTTAMTRTSTTNVPSVTYSFPGTSASGYQVNMTTNVAAATNFKCSAVSDFQTAQGHGLTLPTQVVTPVGNYTIAYENTPGKSGYVTGRVASITYPAGGSISFNYSGGSNNAGINCTSGVVPTLTVTINDNNGNNSQWTYVNSNANAASACVAGSSSACNYTVTTTDPTRSNQTVYYFAGEDQTEIASYQGGCPTTVTGCNGGGTVLKTVLTCYNGNTTNCLNPSRLLKN